MLKNKSSDIFWLITNYNVDPIPFIEKIGSDYLIINKGEKKFVDQSYFENGNAVQLANSGHNLSDYLWYIIENYENLPDRIGFAKGNLVPRHISTKIFDSRKNNKGFVSLYGDPKTFNPKFKKFLPGKLVAQQIAPGFYSEITNNWYAKKCKKGFFFPRIQDFYFEFFKRQPPEYITFIPGACMIVPVENIKRWPLSTYKTLYDVVTYDFFPVEAYHLERSMLDFFFYPLE